MARPWPRAGLKVASLVFQGGRGRGVGRVVKQTTKLFEYQGNACFTACFTRSMAPAGRARLTLPRSFASMTR